MAGWHHWLDGRESRWTPGAGDGQWGLACCDSWGRKESDTTERLIWSDLIFLGNRISFTMKGSSLFFSLMFTSSDINSMTLLWWLFSKAYSIILLSSLCFDVSSYNILKLIFEKLSLTILNLFHTVCPACCKFIFPLEMMKCFLSIF